MNREEFTNRILPLLSSWGKAPSPEHVEAVWKTCGTYPAGVMEVALKKLVMKEQFRPTPAAIAIATKEGYREWQRKKAQTAGPSLSGGSGPCRWCAGSGYILAFCYREYVEEISPETKRRPMRFEVGEASTFACACDKGAAWQIKNSCARWDKCWANYFEVSPKIG